MELTVATVWKIFKGEKVTNKINCFLYYLEGSKIIITVSKKFIQHKTIKSNTYTVSCKQTIWPGNYQLIKHVVIWLKLNDALHLSLWLNQSSSLI